MSSKSDEMCIEEVGAKSYGPWESRAFLLALLAVAWVVAMAKRVEFMGDPGIYRSRMVELFAGGRPYLDFPFEHLPLTLLPMAAAWAMGGAWSVEAYTVVFALLMVGCLVATAELLRGVERDFGGVNTALRWAVLAAPLFPMAIFRSDPFPVLVAVIALYAMARRRHGLTFSMELAGVLAKGWPVLYAVPEWMRGRRWRPLLLVIGTLLMSLLLVSAPGFSESRIFSGLHSESVVGASFALWRTVRGDALGLLYEAGATYISVPSWAWLVTVNLGVVLGLVMFARLRPVQSMRDVTRIMAGGVLALLVGTPLLSPQFLLWPTPFLALHPNRKLRVLVLVVTGMTLTYMIGWNSDFQGNPWWIYVLNARNLGLIALGGFAAWAVRPGRRAVPDQAEPLPTRG